MINKYSLKKDGNKNLSENFKVKEFKCKDGSDEILISLELIEVLQKIRNHFKKPVIIVSGYRTEKYNNKIGGAKKSQHILGTASDIKISGITPRQIAEYAETILNNNGGIGLYEYGGLNGFCHVDVREKRARWMQTSKNGSAKNVSGFNKFSGYPTIRKGDKNIYVKELQTLLNKHGFDCGAVDGIFGNKTDKSVRDFQKKYKLVVDGICGQKTWTKLCELGG